MSGRSKTGLLTKSNHQIANVIRNRATPDYQALIPLATQANIDEVFRLLTQNPAARNEFETAFVNKIALQEVNSNEFTNPLAKFKKANLPYGSTIEEIQVGLLEAVAHTDSKDADDNEVWKRSVPPVDVSYHTVNRYDKYKVTIPDQALRGAFLNEGGLARYAAALMQAAQTSDERDEYLVMRQLFTLMDEAGGFFKVNVPDLMNITSSPDEARGVLRTMRAWAGKLQFLSTHYNASGMPMSASADELELFITPEANAAIDVDALAAAFNIDRAEFASRTTLVDELPNGAIAILTTERFFQVYDQIYTTAQIANPSNLTVNHWLHHSQVVSASRFVPAIMFWPGAGTVITEDSVDTATLSPLQVFTNDEDRTPVVAADGLERGAQYIVDGYGLTADGEVKTATTLILTGGEGNRTFVTQKGILEVDINEPSVELVLTQFAMDDPSKTGSITFAVTGDKVQTFPNPSVTDEEDVTAPVTE